MNSDQVQKVEGPACRPSKEQVRAWMMSRLGTREPLPSLDQLRKLLGWVDNAPVQER